MAEVEQTAVGGEPPESSTPKTQRTNGLAVGMDERLADKVNGQVVVVVEGVESNGKKALESSVPPGGPLHNQIGHRKTGSIASTSSSTVSGVERTHCFVERRRVTLHRKLTCVLK